MGLCSGGFIVFVSMKSVLNGQPSLLCTSEAVLVMVINFVACSLIFHLNGHCTITLKCQSQIKVFTVFQSTDLISYLCIVLGDGQVV